MMLAELNQYILYTYALVIASAQREKAEELGKPPAYIALKPQSPSKLRSYALAHFYILLNRNRFLNENAKRDDFY